MEGAEQSTAEPTITPNMCRPRTRCRRFLPCACIFLSLLLCSIGARAQNSIEASLKDLPLSERCKYPTAAVDVHPLPAAVYQNPRSKTAASSKRHRKYDVARIGSRGIGEGLNLYSMERERDLGRELAATVDSEVRIFEDPAVVEYVNRIAQNLVRHSDAKIPFTVKVIDSDEVNAFTLPGGYLYVNTGLLMVTENEAELAGVIAHEVAHVAARHATKTLTKRELFNLATVPLVFLGGGAAAAISQAAGVAGPISFMKFSRNAEREADLLGLEYAYATGYDPAEFVRFFERMRKISHEKKTSFLIKVFATHPMTDDRIRRAQDEIRRMLPPKDQYVVTTSDFEEARTRLLQLRASHSAESETPTLRRRAPDENRQEHTPAETPQD